MWGGVEATMSLLARRQDITPTLHRDFALSFRGRLTQELTAVGANVFDLGVVRLSRPWTVRRSRLQLRSLLARGDYDAVIAHNPWALAAFGPASTASGTALIGWMHGPPSGRSWLDLLATRTRPSRLIANSLFTAEAVRRLFPSVPCEVCYPPCEPPRAEELPAAPLPARAPGQRLILMACRMEPLKGHAVLVDSLARLRGRGDWTCWIAGGAQTPTEERYEHRIRRRAADAGIGNRLHFLGLRRDVPALLRQAYVLCQPNTRAEAFGLAFVEALHRRVPVVTSRLGGAGEVVDDLCGVLVPPGDADALAGTLASMLDDPDRRDRLGAAGPARAASLCDPHEQVVHLARVLGAV
jgi:glycosyltransferase involved in cell wall biosynthesis